MSEFSISGNMEVPSVFWDRSLVSPRSSQTARSNRATPLDPMGSYLSEG